MIQVDSTVQSIAICVNNILSWFHASSDRLHMYVHLVLGLGIFRLRNKSVCQIEYIMWYFPEDNITHSDGEISV